MPRKDIERQGTPGREAGLACEARIAEWRTESGINTQGEWTKARPGTHSGSGSGSSSGSGNGSGNNNNGDGRS